MNCGYSREVVMVPENEEKTTRPGRELYEWLGALLIPVLTAVLLFTFVVRVVNVDGPSMRETLQDDDKLLVLNAALCGTYDRGDIVIFQAPEFEDGQLIVKRVVATEGQTVDIDFASGTVTVDGQPLNEPYTREPTWLDEGLEFPVTVPEGCVFVMGDNRNNSRDSRDAELGPIDTRHIVGRAAVLVLPGKTANLERREWSRMGSLA
jgi:signal peptidase I